MYVQGQYCDRAVGEAIRIIDVKKNEVQYIRNKIGEDKSKLIDVEVRASFKRGAITGLLKCRSRYNHVRIRSKIINPGCVDSCFPRYIKEET